jgi:hypothetical protein
MADGNGGKRQNGKRLRFTFLTKPNKQAEKQEEKKGTTGGVQNLIGCPQAQLWPVVCSPEWLGFEASELQRVATVHLLPKTTPTRGYFVGMLRIPSPAPSRGAPKTLAKKRVSRKKAKVAEERAKNVRV